jgi:hypothetical protein
VTALLLRSFIAAGAVAAIVLIIVINHPKRRELSAHYVLTRLGVGALLATIAYGVVEAQIADVPLAPRLFFVAGGLFWLLLGLVITLIDERKAKP